MAVGQKRAHLDSHDVKVPWRFFLWLSRHCKVVPWFAGGFV